MLEQFKDYRNSFLDNEFTTNAVADSHLRSDIAASGMTNKSLSLLLNYNVSPSNNMRKSIKEKLIQNAEAPWEDSLKPNNYSSNPLLI